MQAKLYPPRLYTHTHTHTHTLIVCVQHTRTTTRVGPLHGSIESITQQSCSNRQLVYKREGFMSRGDVCLHYCPQGISSRVWSCFFGLQLGGLGCVDRCREREGGVNINIWWQTRYNMQIPHLVTILNALVIFQQRKCTQMSKSAYYYAEAEASAMKWWWRKDGSDHQVPAVWTRVVLLPQRRADHELRPP